MLINHMIKPYYIALIFLLCGIYTISFNAYAEMYKWVDEEGNTHYTQNPPPDGVDYETKKPPYPVNTEEAVDSFRQKQEEAREVREAKQKSEDETAKTEEEKAEDQRKCDNIKLRLQSLQRPRISTTDESGNRIRMSEEERIQGIKEAEKKLAEHCK